MTNKETHNTIVDSQFGPKAQSYLTSAVHANGADLEQMAAIVGQRPNAVALDLGCGGGHSAYRLAPLVNTVVAYDLSEQMLTVVAAEAKRRGMNNIVTKLGTAESLPCASESFDLAVTRYSTHHWHDVPAGLGQMRRVLKPDGMAIFMDVMSPESPLLTTWLQSLELLRDPSHVRNISHSEWGALLSASGFAIRSLQQYASPDVADYFSIEKDGSFTVDSVLITADLTT